MRQEYEITLEPLPGAFVSVAVAPAPVATKLAAPDPGSAGGSSGKRPVRSHRPVAAELPADTLSALLRRHGHGDS